MGVVTSRTALQMAFTELKAQDCRVWKRGNIAIWDEQERIPWKAPVAGQIVRDGAFVAH